MVAHTSAVELMGLELGRFYDLYAAAVRVVKKKNER